MKRLMASGVLMVVLAAGCATAPPRPSVYTAPTRGQHPDRIGQDMAQCESWAHQQTGFDPAAETAKGAVVGAVVGGALGRGRGRCARCGQRWQRRARCSHGRRTRRSRRRRGRRRHPVLEVKGGIRPRICLMHERARILHGPRRGDGSTAAAPGAGGRRAAAAAGRRRPPAAARHRDSHACRRGRTPTRSHPAGSLSAHRILPPLVPRSAPWPAAESVSLPQARRGSRGRVHPLQGRRLGQ